MHVYIWCVVHRLCKKKKIHRNNRVRAVSEQHILETTPDGGSLSVIYTLRSAPPVVATLRPMAARVRIAHDTPRPAGCPCRRRHRDVSDDDGIDELTFWSRSSRPYTVRPSSAVRRALVGLCYKTFIFSGFWFSVFFVHLFKLFNSFQFDCNISFNHHVLPQRSRRDHHAKLCRTLVQRHYQTDKQ